LYGAIVGSDQTMNSLVVAPGASEMSPEAPGLIA
jgi:hypothetical protein